MNKIGKILTTISCRILVRMLGNKNWWRLKAMDERGVGIRGTGPTAPMPCDHWAMSVMP